jgi:DNA-binding CsgD family transcriptional regulator
MRTKGKEASKKMPLSQKIHPFAPSTPPRAERRAKSAVSYKKDVVQKMARRRLQSMKSNQTPSKTVAPLQKEVNRLHANGKAPDMIAIRLGIKISKVLALITKP